MASMKAIRCAMIALSLATLSLAAEDSNKFESPAAGFSLKRPAGWRFVSREEVSASRSNLRLSDEELGKLVEQQVNAPLVAMIKNDERSVGLSPNIQVALRPMEPVLATMSPKDILELILPTVQKGFSDFALESPIREFKLSGHQAAEYVATYTLQTKVAAKGGSVFPVRGRTIVVPRGKLLFFIGMVASAGDDQARKEFETILSSITIAE
jgi:hypothetical protein